MFRSDFQQLARTRIREAKILLDSGEWAGAYYLAGLAVECAIKACIAKASKRFEFPDKARTQKCYEHDPSKLMQAAGLDKSIQDDGRKFPKLDVYWTVIVQWKIDCRYDQSITRNAAKDIYSAVVARRYGVLAWLRRHW